MSCAAMSRTGLAPSAGKTWFSSEAVMAFSVPLCPSGSAVCQPGARHPFVRAEHFTLARLLRVLACGAGVGAGGDPLARVGSTGPRQR